MKIKLLILFLLTINRLISSDISIQKIANVPSKSLYVTQPRNEKDLLFVLNQKGKIFIVKNNKTLKKPFLDISDRVHGSLTPGSEEGLLGLAFHPKYQQNGYFYVNYVNKNDSSIVSRFSVSNDPEIADVTTEKIILKVVNTTVVAKTIDWDIYMWYNGVCKTCDVETGEYHKTISLAANEQQQGGCSIYSNFDLCVFAQFTDVNYTRNKQVLTKYELADRLTNQ